MNTSVLKRIQNIQLLKKQRSDWLYLVKGRAHDWHQEAIVDVVKQLRAH